MFYDAEQDPLCYEGTSILRNSLGLRDQDELTDFEFTMFLSRTAEPLPDGDFDYPHYRAIHRHLFQDVYEWAGETRSIRIAKGGNWFCYPEHIESQASDLFRWLANRKNLTSLNQQEFVEGAAYFLAELNAIHAFREGNGRTQLAFLKLLVVNAGRTFNDDALDPDRTLAAMIASFTGDLELLTMLIADIIG